MPSRPLPRPVQSGLLLTVFCHLALRRPQCRAPNLSHEAPGVPQARGGRSLAQLKGPLWPLSGPPTDWGDTARHSSTHRSDMEALPHRTGALGPP